MVTIITKWDDLMSTATLIHASDIPKLGGMEFKRRTWTKAVTWQSLGLLVMTGVNNLYLDNLQQSMGLSAVLAGLGLVTYVAHEWLWARVKWGLRPPQPPRQPAP